MLGFNYDFGALNFEDRPNELNQAIRGMLTANFTLLDLLHDLFPITQIIVSFLILTLYNAENDRGISQVNANRLCANRVKQWTRLVISLSSR